MNFQPSLQALSPWVAAFGVTPNTRIATPQGDRMASTLTVGDAVTTRDDGPQPITDLREALASPTAQHQFPVCIEKGALGCGTPQADLHIGPQHRVLLENVLVQLLFGEDAMLVRARSLAASPANVAVLRSAVPESYMQISLARQAVIYAEGLPVETILHDGESDLPFATMRTWEVLAAVS